MDGQNPREGFIKVIRHFVSAWSWAYGSYAHTIGEQLHGDVAKAGLTVCRKDEVTRLLADWIGAEVSFIMETSTTDNPGDFASLVNVARKRAKLLGVEWSDDLVPDYVQERVASNRPIS